MNKLVLIALLTFVILLAGCSPQTPPANPSFFAPLSDSEPFICNNTYEGYVYYNNVSHIPYICNSTNWTSMVN